MKHAFNFSAAINFLIDFLSHFISVVHSHAHLHIPHQLVLAWFPPSQLPPPNPSLHFDHSAPPLPLQLQLSSQVLNDHLELLQQRLKRDSLLETPTKKDNATNNNVVRALIHSS